MDLSRGGKVSLTGHAARLGSATKLDLRLRMVSREPSPPVVELSLSSMFHSSLMSYPLVRFLQCCFQCCGELAVRC